MRLNYGTCIVGEHVVLAPYRPKFVPQYHAWMSDEEIRAQTASEELSLEEEYDMQRSWRDDDDKLTFIILERSRSGADAFSTSAMVGDVNIFLNDPDSRTVAEVEVMIAEKSARRKSLGTEAILLMLRYARANLGIMRFYAKIGAANEASLALFRNRLGFRDVNFVAAFQEFELELLVPEGEVVGDKSEASSKQIEQDDVKWNWADPLNIVSYTLEPGEEDDSVSETPTT